MDSTTKRLDRADSHFGKVADPQFAERLDARNAPARDASSHRRATALWQDLQN